MCKQYSKELDDSWFDDLNPVLKTYMYEHWCRDQEEAFEMTRSQAILIGSFHNPTAAQDMLKSENPDFASSDEDFEQSLRLIEENKKETLPKRKRQRRKALLPKNSKE
jgi:hypothetical protein